MSLGSFKNVIKQNVYINHVYLIYMYKQDLALNNQQVLICYKTKPNQTKLYITPQSQKAPLVV